MSKEKYFLKWNNNLSVQIQEIDNQHKKLIELLNNLFVSFLENKHKEKIEEIVDGLIDYTKFHFSTEEKYFHRFNYSKTKEHIQEHKNFIEEVEKFKHQLGKANGKLYYDIINFLRNWISNHIQKSDKEYSTLFIEKGLK